MSIRRRIRQVRQVSDLFLTELTDYSSKARKVTPTSILLTHGYFQFVNHPILMSTEAKTIRHTTYQSYINGLFLVTLCRSLKRRMQTTS